MNPEFWNARYAAADYAYGRAPNVFFAEWMADRTPGMLLLPCDGEGRNAVYAARLGWQVRAADFSSAGRKKALTLAAEAGVDIDFVVEDVLTASWPKDHFDMIALCFAHFPEDERRILHHKCVASLKPGGHLVLEAFSKEQIGNISGGPRKEPILYDPADLADDFSALDIELLTTADVQLDEGIYHQGLASVVRLVGKKRLQKS
ncbi:MAG: class I SAM-dependent methyltransferase [Saprospiraceae bacterium]|nr:class I SAM-dependent methyltransferase [Saprospiraceae bacterium]